ncbi:MAG: rRNA maturation RNase YbeY [Actinomycetota bacterium]
MDSDPPDTRLDLNIFVSDEQNMPVDQALVKSVAQRTAAGEGAHGELSITLVDAKRMAELKVRYLGGSGPTDVLSFPIDGPDDPFGGAPRMIGEIVICPEFIACQAPEDFAGELSLVTAHGVLHLLGYDHDTEQSAATMRAREQELTGRAGARAS